MYRSKVAEGVDLEDIDHSRRTFLTIATLSLATARFRVNDANAQSMATRPV
jgi:hypothetical protein